MFSLIGKLFVARVVSKVAVGLYEGSLAYFDPEGHNEYVEYIAAKMDAKKAEFIKRNQGFADRAAEAEKTEEKKKNLDLFDGSTKDFFEQLVERSNQGFKNKGTGFRAGPVA